MGFKSWPFLEKFKEKKFFKMEKSSENVDNCKKDVCESKIDFNFLQKSYAFQKLKLHKK